nr:retrotransposon protein, putative, Ty1-copia subclass [Tanacetum cinerariifolium]
MEYLHTLDIVYCFHSITLVYMRVHVTPNRDLKRELRVSCYIDAGYLTDADDLKSQTGYVFVLNCGVVDWNSAKQSIFATSSAEAEYIAAFDASKEAVWVKEYQEKDKIGTKPDQIKQKRKATFSPHFPATPPRLTTPTSPPLPSPAQTPNHGPINEQKQQTVNNLEEKQLEEEQAVKAQSWKLLVCYDDDDDEEGFNSLQDNIISELPSYSVVTPTEPIDSLSMRDEHLNTIPAMESDEFIKSCVENLVPNLKKIYSNPLFDEEIIPMEIDQHSFNAESDLIESVPNHDSSITIPSKIDSLFDEFAGELILLKSIPPGIDETDCHPEEELRLTKRLLYDNSSPRLPEEINLSFNPDDPMPPSIEDDDYDSGRDVLILKELLDNYSLSLPANESYHFDIPSPYRPPAKPPDGITGTLNIKMMGDVSDQKVKLSDLKQALHGRHPMLINQHSLNAKSDLIESLPNHDSSITISSKIDPLFDEFASELTILKSFPPGIDKTDCHPEKEIRFAKRLLYDNSSPLNFSFHDDNIEEISSGSTTTHFDVSLSEYDSFIFDLSNDQCPPTDRSNFTHEEFVNELAHIISPPKYDCFYFRNLPDPGELMYVLNSGIRENLLSTTCENLPIEDDHSPLLKYVVWIFLAYLTYPILLIFTHSGMKTPSLTQASPLIVCIRLSLVYLIGVELSRNSILIIVT